MKLKPSTNFFLFVLGIFFIAIAPKHFSHGMFMDGVYYATVARNMAENLGSFWNPMLTETLGKNFHEHPPLAFGFQSLFFTVFGDYHWVEKLYSLLCYLIGGTLVINLWKKITPQNLQSFFWLPLLLWLTIPKMVWGTSNNLLENTMMLFLLASVIYQIKGLNTNKLWPFLVAGIMLFLGFLSKGFTSLFPLSFLFFYWVFIQPFSFWELIKKYSMLLSGLILPFGILFLVFPASIESLTDYYNIQIIGGMSSDQASVGSRFYIIRRVSQELLTMIILTILVLGIWKYKNKASSIKLPPLFFVFLTTALSGVLPILISMKQSTFYVIPAFPLFSIAFAILVATYAKNWINSFSKHQKFFRIFKFISIALFVAGSIVIWLPINQINRDKAKLTDIILVTTVIDEHENIGIHKSIRREWSYYSYFYRYGKINIDYKFNKNRFVISPKGVNFDNSNYKKMDLDLESIDLYQKQ